MSEKKYGSDSKSALEAKFEAQKIAFAPIMFQAARALRELGILEEVSRSGSGGVSADTVAARLNLPSYGVEVLLDAGLSIGVIRMDNGMYILTKTGFFLLTDTLTRVNMDFVNDVCYRPMFHLEDSVKTGRPEGLKVFGEWETIYQALSELPSKVRTSWFNFDHYYSDILFPEAMPIIFRNHPRKILDVGGNTGKFAMHCMAYDPRVQVTILDLEGQLKEAYENIGNNGFSHRIDGIAMDLLDHDKPFPSGYDAIWMSQFLDCFSKEDILELLKRSVTALDKASFLYIVETFWDRQKYEASAYSLNATSLYFTCIANGCSRMYHSADMLSLIDQAGLKVVEEFTPVGISHTILQCAKKL
jgi:hypothetical protein